MPTITTSLKERAQAVALKTEKHLTPARSTQIAGHVSLLLKHYYVDAKIPPVVMEGLALQWLECLETFPEWAIKHAVVEYLREDSKGRKPSPGQIVVLCRQAVSKYHALLHRCRQIASAQIAPPKPQPPTDEERARVAVMLDEVKKNLKMPDSVTHD